MNNIGNIRSKLNWVIGALEGLVDGGGSTEYVNVGSQYLTILSVKLQQCLKAINQYDLLSESTKSNSSCSEIPNNSKHKLLGTDLEYTVVECSQCQFAFKTYTGQKICNECSSSNRIAGVTSKPSQSPCEHVFRERLVLVETDLIVATEPLWLCQKCGLVTCKNPFGSDNGQNPNE